MKSLKFRGKMILGTVVIFLVGFGLLLGGLQHRAGLDREVMAAVSNPSPASPGYMMVVVTYPSSLTTDTSNLVRFKMPWPATLVGVSAIVRHNTSGGVAAIEVREGTTSVLSSTISLSSGSATEGTISDSAIADEATIAIDFDVTSGIWTDPTVQLNFKRK